MSIYCQDRVLRVKQSTHSIKDALDLRDKNSDLDLQVILRLCRLRVQFVGKMIDGVVALINIRLVQPVLY